MNISTRIILVNTTLPANIGAAARAMKTMGLHDLVLVAPKQFPHADASALASSASDVLAQARVVATLEEAIADCQLVLGASARNRTIGLPQLDARSAGEAAEQHARVGAKVAFVFGREDRGLTNDELMLCHAHVFIPTNPEYGVLNVAAAVQVLAYEARMACLLSKSEDAAEPEAGGFSLCDRRENIPVGSHSPSMAREVAPTESPRSQLNDSSTPVVTTGGASNPPSSDVSPVVGSTIHQTSVHEQAVAGADLTQAGALRAMDGEHEPTGMYLRRPQPESDPHPQPSMPMTLVPWDEELVNGEDMTQFYAHCERTLIAIGFLDPENPRQIMTRLRRLFGRTRLDRPEYNLLRGFFKRVLALSGEKVGRGGVSLTAKSSGKTDV
ncbi:MAG: RNA methyltransferase [Pseudomonadota bacterium]